eukprot:Polyplicarium_translucidae@DN3100_c0_g1_i1.p1
MVAAGMFGTGQKMPWYAIWSAQDGLTITENADVLSQILSAKRAEKGAQLDVALRPSKEGAENWAARIQAEALHGAKVEEPRPAESPAAGPKKRKREAEGVISVHTDGSCRSNGKGSAAAGWGAFFGDADPRNVSGVLPGPLTQENQTNSRAELYAILRALEAVQDDERPVEIGTDSTYSMKCFTQWHRSWQSNGWKTASGQPVKNQDIIRNVQALIDERGGIEGGRVSFVKVKGHGGVYGNEMADKLATEASLQQQQKCAKSKQ